MLYIFKSKVTGNLVMLEPNGRRILEIMGKSPEVQGIIQPVQMPVAIAAIEAAIAQDEKQKVYQAGTQDIAVEDRPVDDNLADQEVVSLRRRALPMLEMLRRCYQADVDIVWGV